MTRSMAGRVTRGASGAGVPGVTVARVTRERVAGILKNRGRHEMCQCEKLSANIVFFSKSV